MRDPSWSRPTAPQMQAPEEGRILAACHDGAYVIRMEGDVRLTLCTTIDDYIQQMFADPGFTSVWVDLCDAQNIDSTTLGLLAKLALGVKERFKFEPAIYTCEPGIIRQLKSMGFQHLFDIHEEACDKLEDVSQIPAIQGDEQAVREKVIEAHRVLMGISEENRVRFQDLMAALERG